MASTIEELVAIAKAPDAKDEAKANKDARLLKDIEVFISDSQLKSSCKKVHNLLVYELYRQWYTGDEPLNCKHFMEAFSYYFPKQKNKQNNICFNLALKHTKGKFDLSKKNLDRCRKLYGKKKEVKEVTDGLPKSGSEVEPNSTT